MLRKVDALPSRGRGEIGRDIQSFVADEDMGFAELTIEGSAPQRVAGSAREYIKRNGITGVRVAVRDGHTYLYREGA